jgi:hypothetical protein
VGCPRVVVGAAAQMASVSASAAGCSYRRACGLYRERVTLAATGVFVRNAVRLLNWGCASWAEVERQSGLVACVAAPVSHTRNQSPTLAGLVPAGRQLAGLQLLRTIAPRCRAFRLHTAPATGALSCCSVDKHDGRAPIASSMYPLLSTCRNEVLGSVSVFLHAREQRDTSPDVDP